MQFEQYIITYVLKRFWILIYVFGFFWQELHQKWLLRDFAAEALPHNINARSKTAQDTSMAHPLDFEEADSRGNSLFILCKYISDLCREYFHVDSRLSNYITNYSMWLQGFARIHALVEPTQWQLLVSLPFGYMTYILLI